MTNEPIKTTKRVLEPYDRISEVFFGLIMVLTFTGSLSVAEAGRDDVRAMLIGALGCNLAWGIIDAILYLMGCLSEQGRGIHALQALRKAAAPQEAHGVIAGALPPMVAGVLSPAEYESVRQKLLQLPEPSSTPRLDKTAWLGAIAVFLWVFLSTLPVAIPFVFIQNCGRALRVSNGIAIGLLFVSGYAFGRITKYHPLVSGLVMVLLGSVLVAITMALGG